MENTWTINNSYSKYMRKRVRNMIKIVDLLAVSSITDLGCGNQNLKKYIKNFNTYYPVDALYNSNDVIIRDFNNKEFFEKKVDLIFCSGIIEYIRDYKWFIGKIAENADNVLLSYHFKDNNPRRRKLWSCEITMIEMFSIFYEHGYIVDYFNTSILHNESIVLFRKTGTKSIKIEAKSRFKFNRIATNLTRHLLVALGKTGEQEHPTN